MQEKNPPRTNQERSGSTRAALLAAARGLFVEKGYAATSTPEIVEAAGITRGALYHHFADKQALFRAVVEAEAAAVAARIEAAGTSEVPLAALLSGGEAYLAAMAVPGRTRLLLVDGPAVLGHAAMDAIDRETSAGTLEEGLAAAFAGRKDVPVHMLAVLLSAAFDRAALAVEDGEKPAAIRKAIAFLLESLTKDGQRG